EVAGVPASSSVATEVARRYLGPVAVGLLAMAMMISTLGSLHTGTLSGARITYAMARDRLFFESLGRLSRKSRVPVNALLVMGVWSCVLALSGSFDKLTNYVIFAAWIFYGMNTASVFIFRRRMPDAERPYRTLGYPFVPVVFLLVTLWLLSSTVMATPFEALVGFGIILLGLPIYWYWSRRRTDDERGTTDDERDVDGES
ncbi:MAG TPA: APC family permease, partial [Pyrinomonadaceae bacterium]|nr:APC family permease [Pyrinomonadaceae bacterium]